MFRSLPLRRRQRNALPRLYVITAHNFNHVERPAPIDPRLLDSVLQPVFYFVDAEGVPADFRGDSIAEIDINPGIAAAGRSLLAEWSFLLTELERPFASYPFYTVSSRFFEKNRRLPEGLVPVWKSAAWSLEQFGWGYLPSYDRDPNFQDLAEYREAGRLGMADAGLAFIDGFWGVRIPDEYRYISDFFCNYIGFHSRQHFERYMKFYLPFIRRFLAPDWSALRNPEIYVRRRDVFRSEKPFTLYLEMVSHMFFYLNALPFGGLSYDGLYRVDERRTEMTRIAALS